MALLTGLAGLWPSGTLHSNINDMECIFGMCVVCLVLCFGGVLLVRLFACTAWVWAVRNKEAYVYELL